MFTASEYRIAAEVIREEIEGKAPFSIEPSASRLLEEKADQVEARDRALLHLGNVAYELSKANSAIATGTSIVSHLLERGWTPPEGLF
jgi:hypothetical protein